MSVSAFPKTPMNQCFENSLILQKILHFTSPQHSVRYLELRLINKLFNAEFLYRIRRTHRKISFDFRENPRGASKMAKNHDTFWFLVNLHRTNIDRAQEYFQFLVRVAGVKISEVRCGDFRPREKQMHRLHDVMMQSLLLNQSLTVFTGVAELCKDGCSGCNAQVFGCEELDLQFEVLKNCFTERKKHFKKLIVTDLLIRTIAIDCSNNSGSQEQCLEALNLLITPNISCDTLHFVLNDRTLIERKGGYTLPLEVLTLMRDVWLRRTENWKEKSIALNFPVVYMATESSSQWSWKNYFTEFRFDWEHQRIPKSQHVFAQVDINFKVYLQFIPAQLGNFDVLIANLRRLFPTQNVFFNDHTQPRRTHLGVISQDVFQRMLQAVWGQEAIRGPVVLTNRLSINLLKPSIDILEHLQFGRTQLQMSVSKLDGICYEKTEYDGEFPEVRLIERPLRIFTITDNNKCSGSKLKLEVYADKRQLPEVMQKEQVDNGFLKYFL